MHEFLIRCTTDEWFDITQERTPSILKPIATIAEPIAGWGSHRIRVEGEEIAFSIEDVGIQVSFESGTMDWERARSLVDEMCKNIEKQTGQGTRIVEI